MVLSIPYLLALVVLLIPALIIDIRQHRIPNWLSLPFWLIGIGLHVFLQGWDGFLNAGGGWLIMMGMMLPFSLLGLMGAGDVKLMAAVGTIVGSGVALQVLLGIVLTGLFLSLLILLRQGLLGSVVSRFLAIAGLGAMARRMTYMEPADAEKKLVLPYAIPIAVGTMIALAMMAYF